jgi:hypothetical protein
MFDRHLVFLTGEGMDEDKDSYRMIADFEKNFRVSVITFNKHKSHENAGSTDVTHLSCGDSLNSVAGIIEKGDFIVIIGLSSHEKIIDELYGPAVK